MPARIVVFGATGYTGRLTAERLVALGERPVLAGRSEDAPGGARASGSAGSSIGRRRRRHGRTSVRGARRAGRRAADHGRPVQALGRAGGARPRSPPARVYLDSTGEPPFIRRVFQAHDAPARRAGRDAAARDGLRLRAGRARRRARARGGGRARGPRRRRLLRARRRAGRAEPRHARVARRRRARPRVRVPRRARHRRALGRADPHVRASAGKERPAISVGGAEHFTLPAAFPRLREVNVYLGWFGALARARTAGSRASALRHAGARGAPRARRGGGQARRHGRRAGARAPRRATHVLHRRRGLRRRRRAARRGPPLGRRRLRVHGGHAWPGPPAAPPHGAPAATGAAGPLEAFGLDALEQGCAEAGLTRVA